MGSTITGGPSLGISPRRSRVLFSRHPIVCRGCSCCLFRGPTNYIATEYSQLGQAIVSFFPRSVQGRFTPIKELSGSARNFLLVAGSKRLARHLLSPTCRIGGACFMRMSRGVPSAATKRFTRNISVNSRGHALPTSLGVLKSHRTRLAVSRNEFRRIGHVFTSIKYGIACLGQVSVKALALKALRGTACHGLARRRLTSLGGRTRGGRSSKMWGCMQEMSTSFGAKCTKAQSWATKFYVYIQEHVYESSIF